MYSFYFNMWSFCKSHHFFSRTRNNIRVLERVLWNENFHNTLINTANPPRWGSHSVFHKNPVFWKSIRHALLNRSVLSNFASSARNHELTFFASVWKYFSSVHVMFSQLSTSITIATELTVRMLFKQLPPFHDKECPKILKRNSSKAWLSCKHVYFV